MTKAFLFIGYIKENKKLYKTLQKYGYTLIFKPTLKLKNAQIKGNVDAELTLHAMIELKNYDKAILISGDGDFYCLINYLISQNKLKKVLIPNKSAYSSLLRKFRNNITFMNNLKNKLQFTNKKREALPRD